MKTHVRILPALAAAALLIVLAASGCSEAASEPEASAAPAAEDGFSGEAIPAEDTPEPNPTASPAVFLDGFYCAPSAVFLPLSGRSVTAEELSGALKQLPEVRRAELRDARFTSEERARLRAERPDIVFQWPVEVLGQTFLSTDTTISFAGRGDLDEGALREIREAAAEFYGLRTIDLTGCPLENDALHELDTSLPDTDVRWTFDLYGASVCSTDREIDLSGRKVKDKGAALEEALPLFPNLEKVVMCDCGVSDKDMDALNQKYEDIRFVWMVDVQWAAIRTDAEFFTPYRASGVTQTHRRAGLKNLWYCTDLVALDIGHSHTSDLGFLTVMPHLKYLIIVENYVTDPSLLGGLRELKWLEMFQCSIRDISPLVNCTALEDLNICYITAPGDNVYETLRQMTWLKRLWCSGTRMSKAQLSALKEELPDCEIWCLRGDESTGSTWRYSESYYEMRDAFHMYYMDIMGNPVRRLDEEGLAKMHRRFWKD